MPFCAVDVDLQQVTSSQLRRAFVCHDPPSQSITAVDPGSVHRSEPHVVRLVESPNVDNHEISVPSRVRARRQHRRVGPDDHGCPDARRDHDPACGDHGAEIGAGLTSWADRQFRAGALTVAKNDVVLALAAGDAR
jgi:hypothetical protein